MWCACMFFLINLFPIISSHRKSMLVCFVCLNSILSLWQFIFGAFLWISWTLEYWKHNKHQMNYHYDFVSDFRNLLEKCGNTQMRKLLDIAVYISKRQWINSIACDIVAINWFGNKHSYILEVQPDISVSFPFWDIEENTSVCLSS